MNLGKMPNRRKEGKATAVSQRGISLCADTVLVLFNMSPHTARVGLTLNKDHIFMHCRVSVQCGQQ